jgi:hypothetical protein
VAYEYKEFDELTWDIRREGRRWSRDEVDTKYFSMPEKMELIEGKLYWSDKDRLKVLASLLEHMGADATVKLGDPAVWRAAIADLPQ